MSRAGWAAPLGLFGLALALRLVAMLEVPFPATEVSAWYAGAARRMVAGEWFTTDMVWSYATPPLMAPRPGFELWLPMSSLLSALGMTLLGTGYAAAQLPSALLGALLSPLAWAVAREAAWTARLDARRARAVAVTAGLVTAIVAPFVLPSVVPDSTMPFSVFGVAAALLMPRAIGLRARSSEGGPDVASTSTLAPGLALGACLGLAYLCRQEAIWLGVAFLVMLGAASRSGAGRGRAGRRLGPVVVGGLAIVGPWLLRNVAAFGTAFPGPTLENAVLRRNLDVFAYLDRPGLAGYLDQGLPTLLGNPLAAAWHQLTAVLVLPAFPVGLAGLLGVVAMRRSAALRGPTALSALLVSGALTFVSTALLFPVATLWGTFLHAAGPLLVGLVVVAALWGDSLVSRLSERRGWQPVNVVIAPIALLAIAVPISLLQLSQTARMSRDLETRYVAIAGALRTEAERSGRALPEVLMSDHPMWLATVLDRAAIALPDEPPESVAQLAGTFGAPWLVLVEERGRYPAILTGPEAAGCLEGPPVELGPDDDGALLIELRSECERA